MQIKSCVLAGLVAAASATSFNNQWNTQQQVGKEFTHEYVRPNVEEVCFSVRPVASCDDQHVASYVKHQKVGFHCINESNPIAKQFQREADQGKLLPLESKTQDVQAYVEVPVRCERINSEEKRLRKETEKTFEQKVHIVQQQDDEESFLFEHKPWTNDLEQDQSEERQYQRQLTRKNQQNKHQSSGFLDNEDSIEEESLDTMEQYGDLISKKTTMHSILKMKDDQFDRLMEHLKFIAHQNRRSDKWSQQLDQILPNVFSRVAKQFFETVLENQTNSQQEKEEVYEQYKEVVKRIYAYAVKQTLQMRRLNQITGKINSGEHQKYIANHLARNLWYKIQHELTPKQVEEIREMAEKVQNKKPQLDRILIDETLVAFNKDQMKQLEKDLTKVLTAGLMSVSHKFGNNQNESEEYRKYHGEDYEQEFRTQYPKLSQKLSAVAKNSQWN